MHKAYAHRQSIDSNFLVAPCVLGLQPVYHQHGCPICKKRFAEPADPAGQKALPFCSERCKLIDLGRWLDGSYQIPVEISPEDDSADGHDRD